MPAKRHPSLIPLSHDHHLGLVLAFRLCQGLPRTRKLVDSPQEQLDETIHFFHENLTVHFRAEEEVLFPALRTRSPQAATLVDTLVTEHREMRVQVEQLAQTSSNETRLPALLRTFGELLERHIRREERELFPLYEAHTPEAEATRFGTAIAHILGRDQ